MRPGLRMDEASQALGAVEAARGQVVDAVSIPVWFWWVVGLVVIGIGAAADSRRPGIIVGVTVPGALVIAAAMAWTIAGRGRAQVSKDLLGPTFVLGLIGLVWVLVGASLGLAFGLRAAGVGHPGLAGSALCAAGLMGGGPLFSARLRRSMLRRGLRP